MSSRSITAAGIIAFFTDVRSYVCLKKEGKRERERTIIHDFIARTRFFSIEIDDAAFCASQYGISKKRCTRKWVSLKLKLISLLQIKHLILSENFFARSDRVFVKTFIPPFFFLELLYWKPLLRRVALVARPLYARCVVWCVGKKLLNSRIRNWIPDHTHIAFVRSQLFLLLLLRNCCSLSLTESAR